MEISHVTLHLSHVVARLAGDLHFALIADHQRDSFHHHRCCRFYGALAGCSFCYTFCAIKLSSSS